MVFRSCFLKNASTLNKITWLLNNIIFFVVCSLFYAIYCPCRYPSNVSDMLRNLLCIFLIVFQDCPSSDAVFTLLTSSRSDEAAVDDDVVSCIEARIQCRRDDACRMKLESLEVACDANGEFNEDLSQTQQWRRYETIWSNVFTFAVWNTMCRGSQFIVHRLNAL